MHMKINKFMMSLGLTRSRSGSNITIKRNVAYFALICCNNLYKGRNVDLTWIISVDLLILVDDEKNTNRID